MMPRAAVTPHPGRNRRAAVPQPEVPRGRPGKVFLVGAGPGDPELITVRGLACLRRADVVVYDRLVHPQLLDEAPAWAEKIYVGKAPGRHSVPQEEIQDLLVRCALAGETVVRLKGGDPFVFGRGGEEAAACAAAGVSWEVVPGVSSAVAVPAAAAIPVTHRDSSASFAVVTAHRSADAGEPDWAALAKIDTLVVLMGVARLAQVAAALIHHGRGAETPAAVVERGTLPEQRVITGTLGDLAGRAAAAGVRSPATVIVGPVVELGSRLAALQQQGRETSGAEVITLPWVALSG
jgi:uroporphyrin-III C-methyltransferase